MQENTELNSFLCTNEAFLKLELPKFTTDNNDNGNIDSSSEKKITLLA